MAKEALKEVKVETEPKKESLFIKILKEIFVKNIALKGTAILLGVLTFIIINVF